MSIYIYNGTCLIMTKQWDCHGTNTPRRIGKYTGCTHTHIHPKELLSSWNTEASHFTFKMKNYSPKRERERGGRHFIYQWSHQLLTLHSTGPGPHFESVSYTYKWAFTYTMLRHKNVILIILLFYLN